MRSICEVIRGHDLSFRFTYEIAPVFVLMEEEILNKLAVQVGWYSYDGILSPGGSINNLYACMIARSKACPGMVIKNNKKLAVARFAVLRLANHSAIFENFYS